MNNLRIYKWNKSAKLPTRNVETDAGLDLYALDDVFIPVGKTVVISTGISIEVPNGYVGKIEDRSSLASKGLRSGAGVVDCGYSGQIGVVLHNLTANLDRDSILLRDGYQVKAGDKIAQLLLYRIETPYTQEVTELWDSKRGSRGFGSSGA